MSNDIRSILYAADLSEGCEPVLAYAIDLANRLGARLNVLTVISDERVKSLVEIDTGVPQEYLDKYHDDRARRVRQHIDAQIAAFYAVRADKNAPGPIAEITVHEGDDVAQLILDKANGAEPADLIVLASRGEGVLAGLLFGSVVQEVTRKTRIPLLLVPVGEGQEASDAP